MTHNPDPLRSALELATSNHKSVVESKRRTELRLRAALAALQQIYTVCNGNAGEGCDQRMTVNFIREVARDTFEKVTTRDVSDAALASPQGRDAVIEECARTLETNYPDHGFLNAYCAAIRALKSSAPPGTDTWQPIETAPRDGTAILGVWWAIIYAGREPEPKVGIVCWSGGWTPYDRVITHWQPLPAPPVERKG